MIGVSGVAIGLAAALLTVQVRGDCESYGIDFQNGGSYFQNNSSTDPFTFVSIFEGCNPDVCNNILVDPTGDEYQCSDTNLTPDDSTQMSTCPLDKDQLYSGAWSVILISNNGDGDPIAYERDFSLTVGVPVTSTFTPTVTLSSTLTPIVNTTTTVPNLISATVNTTVTEPSRTAHPTTTVTPKKVIIRSTKTMATIKKTAYTILPVLVAHTHTASCVTPRRQQHPDPTCHITPTLISAAALSTSTSNKAGRIRGSKRVIDRAVPLDREQRIAERKERLAAGLEKRSPDNATVTVTDTNINDYITTTFVSTAPATTLVITTATNTTTTLTNTFTTFSGKTTLSRVTVTAPTPTSTHTKYTVATTTVSTKTFSETINIWTTYVNPGASAVCKAKGGKMV